MIIAVVGPTGVGKTKLSIELAKRYNGIIINADAMQVYKGLDIGTAKIKESEKEGILHYLFDIADVSENYTVYQYQKDARALIDKFFNRTIIFVGGTGLYLKAALFDYRFSLEEEKLDLSNFSNDELFLLCKRKDKLCDIHKNNRRRMERFLSRKDVFSVEPRLLYDVKFIGLTTERDKLYSIINNRVDQMVKDGLEDEVKYFFDQGIDSKALNTAIGYKEFYKYFRNEISRDECVELIKKNSRHYAKRQYTFFRHQFPIKWFEVNYDDFSKTIDNVIMDIEG